MSADPFTDAATSASEDYVRTPKMNVGTFRDRIAEAYMDAAEWARDHLAAQEPTDADVADNVANLIRDLIDPDDCWFDHGGGCQAHGYLSLTPDQECPHSEAKRLLAARAARLDEEKP